jgi:hypothetical protein
MPDVFLGLCYEALFSGLPTIGRLHPQVYITKSRPDNLAGPHIWRSAFPNVSIVEEDTRFMTLIHEVGNVYTSVDMCHKFDCRVCDCY